MRTQGSALGSVVGMSINAVAAMMAAVALDAPGWVLVCMTCMLTVLVAYFLFAHARLSKINPDALRSERRALW